jgi:glycosyltransferase involved in cell wall biosynthesis
MKHPLTIALVVSSLLVILFGLRYTKELFQKKNESKTVNKDVNNMKLSIVIPAYNEENRIERTLRTYHQFFTEKNMPFELVVVLNGCKDNTIGVVERVRKDLVTNSMVIIDLPQAGKGLAIKAGFADALTRNNDLIGFVDADMATRPEAYYDLIANIGDNDGIIASRYMPGAQISPPRPAYKRYGSKLIYEPLLWLLFGLSYYDFQCGAKLFKRHVLEVVNPQLTVTQWGFDAELLYLCKKNNFTVIEIPTIWEDQAESKLTLKGGVRMLGSLFKVWWQHLFRRSSRTS